MFHFFVAWCHLGITGLCCAKQRVFFKRVKPLSLTWIFMQRCFKLPGQTHSDEAFDIGTTALKFSPVWIAWVCSVLSDKQCDSPVVHLRELTLPDNFTHTQCKVEFMLEKIIVVEFVMRSCSMSCTGNGLVSIGFVWVNTNLGFFPHLDASGSETLTAFKSYSICCDRFKS